MIRHITFTDKNMTRAAELCRDSALRNGCDTSTIYTYDMLSPEFRLSNSDILSAERGAGYWVWKPQIILQEFDRSEPDDVVFYTDAGVEFVGDARCLSYAMDDHCMLFHNMYWHHEWCKGDAMGLIDNYTPTYQIQASAMLFKYTPLSIHTVSEWLHKCTEPGMIDDSPSKSPNYKGFQEHRHDQAILTSLTIGKIKYHWWPASYCGGQFTYPKYNDRDTYPIIFNHHRKRNAEF